MKPMLVLADVHAGRHLTDGIKINNSNHVA